MIKKTPLYDGPQDVGAKYLPTPEEIRAACANIQKGWTGRERALRGERTAKRVETRELGASHFHNGREIVT